MKFKLLVLAVGICAAVGAVHAQEKISHGRFTDVTLYHPQGEVSSVALFLSGDGGWNKGVIDMAEALVAEGTLVAGINLPQFLANLEKDSGSCVLPDGDLENLSHYLQGYAHLPTYYLPTLVGYSSGATLAYAMLAQAPANTFAGALSLGFCPYLALRKPLCKGEGIVSMPHNDNSGVDLLPSKRLASPWIVLHGEQDRVCPIDATRQFVSQTSNASLVNLPSVGHGYSVTRNWMPQYLSAFRSLSAARSAPPPASLPELPLIEVPATGVGDEFPVFLTGDGGWAGLDQTVAQALATRGVSVVGFDSLRYFWNAQTPDSLAADVDRIVRYYAAHWQRSKVLLIGYSQGADVMPFAVNRLSTASRDLVKRLVLLGPGQRASFEFHLGNWIFTNTDGLLTAPEIERMGLATLCLYGQDEKDSVCREVTAPWIKKEMLSGGHHFNGDYTALVQRILDP